MDQVLLKIPESVHRAVWAHLLPKRFLYEEAAFLYVQRKTEGKAEVFMYIDWVPVPSRGFFFRSPFHFELTDEMRAAVIKHAHEINGSIVELHSHKGRQPAKFSPSDLQGLQEFVPHVWWRLKQRPYLAVVVSRSGFDGFIWLKNPHSPQRLDGIVTETSVLRPTKLSYFKDSDYGKRTF
jgi:hypothetical protein